MIILETCQFSWKFLSKTVCLCPIELYWHLLYIPLVLPLLPLLPPAQSAITNWQMLGPDAHICYLLVPIMRAVILL